MTLHPTVERVTQRIIEKSRDGRARYLELMEREAERFPNRNALSCSNLAHGFAASLEDKPAIKSGRGANLAIVTAYNDMLSAHQPYGRYPEAMKLYAREVGATAQVAGGVPAMCDGVTQGQDGMELSLFSRDTIALSTAVAMSHAMFDGMALLGICDKIVPGLVIGALRFGYLPAIFVPSGPMPSGLANKDKQKVRQLYAEGKATRADLLESESASYHSPGTCTFYGTANSNQMMLELMGLHIPGASFVPPNTPLRSALTRTAVHRLAEIGREGGDYRPMARVVDEKAIVNAVVGLLATGGSTNHAIHLPAMARAAGITLDWQDMDELSAVVPLIARVYPNGAADVNHFHAAGGMGFVVRQLLDAGLIHGDVLTVSDKGMAGYADEPYLDGDSSGVPASPADQRRCRHPRPGRRAVPSRWRDAAGPGQSGTRDLQDLGGRSGALYDRSPGPGVRQPGSGTGRVQGGRAGPRCGRGGPLPGPARQWHARTAQADPAAGRVAGQGLQGRAGHRRADVWRKRQDPRGDPRDARGVSGGPLARVQDGDVIRLCAETGSLEVLADLTGREPAARSEVMQGMGRELFAMFRHFADGAEQGGSAMLAEAGL